MLISDFINVTSSINNFDQTLVSDQILNIFTSYVNTWVSLVFGILGIASNVITIIVFTRMGFKETVNITMTAIAYWDVLRFLCSTVHRLYGPISLVSGMFSKSWQNITTTNLLYLNVIACNVTYIIGSYVALERCICITFPLKIKLIVTPSISFIACTSISILTFSSLFPSLLFLEYRWTTDTNAPIAIYQFSDFYKSSSSNYMGFYQFINVAYPMSSFMIMLVSTVIISYQLKKASKFRNESTLAHVNIAKTILTSKDLQVVKMLLLIIATYMIVLFPRIVNFVAELFEPEYFVLKYYNNIFTLAVYLIFFFDVLSSSIGIFIFYRMSSKFRKEFNALFKITTLTMEKKRHNLPKEL